jgi:hypothetical protein
MMDRFNFYDIYGFVLPGTLLIAIFWLPFGLATSSLPSSEISSTLLLLVLAYITGQLLQMFAEVVVPSKVRDKKDAEKKLRPRSNVMLDATNQTFSEDFKKHLGDQIKTAFSLQILPDDEKAIQNRDSAFMQARTYLLQNKTTGYVEQFEGLYAMMRGFGCAFFVGCAYLVGWGLSFHWQVQGMGEAVWLVLAASITAALVATGFTIKVEAEVASSRQQYFQIEARKKAIYLRVTVFLLFFVAGVGYFLGTWKPAGAQIEFFLWAALPVALIAGIRCLHAYAGYADDFAKTVWNDFSASYQPAPATPAAGAHGGAPANAHGNGGAHSDAHGGGGGHEAHGGGESHGHAGAPKPEPVGAPKPAPEHGHGGGHGGHQGGH